MTGAPLVSVLMTAFNRAPFIGSSIESVLAQTFTDFELLIVDDRSTDGTLDIACDYERRDRRVRVVRNERNLGQFENRNHAAKLARGGFLKFHDSDDLMYPHCLAVWCRCWSLSHARASACRPDRCGPAAPVRCC